ncbi:MAG: ABC transporter ATP-binding protein [Acidimicrobiales bacterium]
MTASTVVGPESASTAGPTLSELRIEDVTVSFGGLRVLDEVSLTASTGEIVGVIGPNGAGKTTLFNVVCGFVRQGSGRVLWRGRELRRQHAHDLAALGIERTLQGVGLFESLDALENVLVGAAPTARKGLVSEVLGLWPSSRNERRQRQRAMEALDRLGVSGYASTPPSALPYPVQKRVALARALVSDPALVMMDEPASGLSISEIADLAELLKELRGDIGVLLVEHNIDLVMSSCDRIVVLDFGKVIASGTPEEVRADQGVTSAYLGRAAETKETDALS